jgi:hypothetical protein
LITATSATNWVEANQRYLTARLSLVMSYLTRHSGQDQDAPATPADPAAHTAVREAVEAMPAPAALDALCQTFALSPFERDVLLMCAGAELNSSFHALWATPRSGSQPGPTFGQALAALPDPHWSALTPAAPLRYWRLIEVSGGETLTTSRLRIDEGVLHYLTGISYLDERLQVFVQLQPSPQDLPASHRELAMRIVDLWAQSASTGGPVIHLAGSDVAGKLPVAAFACATLGMHLHVLRGADVPLNPTEREALARLWQREAVLNHWALLLDCDEAEHIRTAPLLLDPLRTAVLVASRQPLHLRQREAVRLDIDRPSAAEQQRLWRAALGPLAVQLDGTLDMLVSQFNLSAGEIGAASARAAGAPGDHQEHIARRLWDTCRTNARGRLEELADRIEPAAEWADLVLPSAQLQTLRDLAAHVRYRARVYDAWGFASKGTRGLGISALFAGASGTGKTMAAEVLARELQLDLYRIDLSQVVSKYIGETEKNLRRVFEVAETSGAILLFDEADALFGKRSEVKDSHDRYANIEISYLLQRMESYRGLAILTTNMKGALDSAFLRRLRFIVQFPFPDTAQRAEIWRRIYPAATPVESLDVNKLARLNVAGGNIRNIAMHSAFLAAQSDEPVRMGHLLRAARSECAKLEKQLTESECRDWV